MQYGVLLDVPGTESLPVKKNPLPYIAAVVVIVVIAAALLMFTGTPAKISSSTTTVNASTTTVQSNSSSTPQQYWPETAVTPLGNYSINKTQAAVILNVSSNSIKATNYTLLTVQNGSLQKEVIASGDKFLINNVSIMWEYEYGTAAANASYQKHIAGVAYQTLMSYYIYTNYVRLEPSYLSKITNGTALYNLVNGTYNGMHYSLFTGNATIGNSSGTPEVYYYEDFIGFDGPIMYHMLISATAAKGSLNPIRINSTKIINEIAPAGGPTTI